MVKGNADRMDDISIKLDPLTTDELVVSKHSDEIQDIITTVPPWILRWGITVFFAILVLIIALSGLIQYPDIVKANLEINSPNTPKPVVSKMSGKLIKLLAKENDEVKTGDALGYIESTADHPKILALLSNLKHLQKQVVENSIVDRTLLNVGENCQLGEVQTAYQTFFQEYLNYRATVEKGFLSKKKEYLEKDLMYLAKQEQQLYSQKNIEQRDFKIASEEYEMHQKLALEKVETNAELRQAESKYLSKKSPLLQTESAIITGNSNYSAKEKEILELDNQMQEEKSKFLQALNSLISACEDWKSKYVLTAAETGRLTFANLVQENQILTSGEEVFYINPGNEQFFGEMAIPQNNMGKIKEGQEVLVKLKSYPFEEYGILRGRIRYISEVPYKDSVYISRVELKARSKSDMKKTIHLKQGMMANAEIITEDASLFRRLANNVTRMIH